MSEHDQTASKESTEKKALLVVASKVKAYGKAKGFSVSAEAMTSLTEMVERECDKAMERAKADNRKTVKSRDFA